MPTPPLRNVLESEHVSAMLANFAQMLPRSLEFWLVDVEGQQVGCHPPNAQPIETQQLLNAMDRVRQFGNWTWVPFGVVTPVRARGEMVGILAVRTGQDFDAKEKAALQLLARVLGLLTDNRLTQDALLNESLNRYRELNLLYHAGESITSSLDLAQVNRLILDESVRLLQADEGAVMLVDPDTERLTVWASHGLDALHDIGAGIPAGHELAEQVVRSGKTLEEEGRFVVERSKPLSALLCVPLKTKDSVLGVISLAHTLPGNSFQPTDVKLLNALASQAAVALENAQMFSNLCALHAEIEAANRRLLELDKLKSSFIGTITHELRSPFANIVFSLQLIERYGAEGWSASQREQWTQLNRWVREAKRMVDNLVNLAALLSKQGELDLAPVDFTAVVANVVQTLEPLAAQRQVQLHVAATSPLPPLRADGPRLEEAVHHLVHNAIKFNRPGGSVHVRFGPKKDGLLCEVQDTGVGIAPDKLATLWEPFTQAADPLRRGVEGLGLGLTLVQYVIRAHGGKVSVSSQEDVGTTFRFWLPANPA